MNSGEIKSIMVNGQTFPTANDTELILECYYRITRKDKYFRYLMKKLNKLLFLATQIENISGNKTGICLSKKHKIYEKYGLLVDKK